MLFPHAFKKSYLLSSTTVATSGATTALSSGQVGMYAATSASNSTPAIVSASIKPFQVVGGTYFTSDKIGAHGGYKETWKSKVVNPKYISRVIKISAKTAVNQVVKVNAAAFVAVNQTYRLRLDVKGSPALRFLNHQLYRTLDGFSGVVGSTAANVWRDPISVMLSWKDQINSSPIFNQFVIARVYKYAAAQSATSAVTATTSQTTIPATTTTGIVVGQKVTGTGIPANSFVTTVTASTSIVIKYPTQSVAPTIASNVAMKFWSDVYTEAGTAAVIPGTSTATGLTSTAYDATASDASSQTAITAGQESHIEFTAAYVDTVFGNATFTPMDKYDLEPLVVYAAVVDELGNTNLSTSFPVNSASVSASNPYLSSHALEVQAPVQASGIGESVLRDLILSNRYLQNAYPDSSRVDSFRMREIEADPMLAGVTRSSLYDQLIVVHNVPRWNNPSSTFDNDQYVLQFYCAAGSTLDNSTSNNIAKYFIDAAVAAQGANSVALESY